MKTIAVILARGGSKGIPKKNVVNFCGKPLIGWSIEHCLEVGVEDVYVSSDCEEILAVGELYGARRILRPKSISGDAATSESAWLHALEVIEAEFGRVEWVLAPQVTSPLRTATDIRNGLNIALSGRYDSLFSCTVVEDLLFWELKANCLQSVNYDWKSRKRRQDMPKQIIENGSFYLFRPEILREHNNRFGGRIGKVEMESWKMFEIDSVEDLRMCTAIMNEFVLKQR